MRLLLLVLRDGCGVGECVFLDYPLTQRLRSSRSVRLSRGVIPCEGSGDVVGVLTLLVGGVAQAFHDDRVVELRVQLGVQEVEGKDREEQVEVERERRVKEGAP